MEQAARRGAGGGLSNRLRRRAPRGADPAVDEHDRRLLLRHRPLLRYDAQEPYRAISAASMTDNPGNRLLSRDGRLIASVPSNEEPVLCLGTLSSYPPGASPAAGDRIGASPDILAAAQRFQDNPAYRDCVYGRVVRERSGVWLQYWLWFYFNPKHLLGLGRHEGDWELVQVALDTSERPRAATYASHHSGRARRWEQVEHWPGPDGPHPVVYVAPFSHAAYFEPRPHVYLGGVDNPDGLGPEVLPDVRPFEDWVAWPGRWGASPGVLASVARGRLGGASPASPASQRLRWSDPRAFHRLSAARRPLRPAEIAINAFGRPLRPSRPRLGASLDGDRVTVDYAVERAALRRAGVLYLTVHDADDRAAVLATRRVRTPEALGTVMIELPRPVAGVLVRGTAFNRLRQRGDLAEAVARGPASEPLDLEAGVGEDRR